MSSSPSILPPDCGCRLRVASATGSRARRKRGCCSMLARSATGRCGRSRATPQRGAGRGRAREDALEPIGLHECRHTCASLMIAAGCNAKALSKIMGDSDIRVTYNVYGHLMPGAEDEAREQIDAYLERVDGRSHLRA